MIQLVGALESEAVLRCASMHITVKLLQESYTRPQVSYPSVSSAIFTTSQGKLRVKQYTDACEIPCGKKCPRLDSAQDLSSVEFPCFDDYALSDCPHHKASLTTTFKLDEVPSATVTFLFLLF